MFSAIVTNVNAFAVATLSAPWSTILSLFFAFFRTRRQLQAGVSRAGARTGRQPPGHGDMQGFNSSSQALALSSSRRTLQMCETFVVYIARLCVQLTTIVMSEACARAAHYLCKCFLVFQNKYAQELKPRCRIWI